MKSSSVNGTGVDDEGEITNADAEETEYSVVSSNQEDEKVDVLSISNDNVDSVDAIKMFSVCRFMLQASQVSVSFLLSKLNTSLLTDTSKHENFHSIPIQGIHNSGKVNET